MVKLEIIENDGNLYKMKDTNGKECAITIEFYDIESKPKSGNYILISAELLNNRYAGYSTTYAFGSLDNPCGKDKLEFDDIDIVKILKEDKEIILKRLYG